MCVRSNGLHQKLVMGFINIRPEYMIFFRFILLQFNCYFTA